MYLFLVTAVFAMGGAAVATAAPTATFICQEMSFKGPQGLGLYCNATSGGHEPGTIKSGFTIALAGGGPLFSCVNGTATGKPGALQVAGRCHGLPLGTDGAANGDTAAG
ncbi:hypothetical protein [Nocardia sp. NPDC057030]|uniref:hypothetical protein n=1 Tax=unclassified Nocardia TaxID=2637762 RepID=UPI00363529AF